MKSHASSLLEVAACLLKDVAAMCAAENTYDRDLRTIRSRVKNEGVSFLTITLPAFASDLERSLDQGYISDDLFRSFKKRLRIPAFLQGYLSGVFDMCTGRILNEPSITAIAGVRQICLAFKKVKLDCTARRTRDALEKFIQGELVFSEELDPCDVEKFVDVSNCLWGNIFGVGFSSNTLDYIPKHGPGATAEKYSSNSKYFMRRWHERLEPYFPYYGYARPLSASPRGEVQDVTFVPASEEQPVRVIGVPKTLKAPRIIAIEPACMQYTQQAVAAEIVSRLESASPTKGHINFTDQSVNRRLAMTSSKDGFYATIDLSAASDRVPLSLSMRMFDSVPDLQGAVFACRSRRAQVDVDDQSTTVVLQKFASMGSALCFPVEAMYFYTICVLALLESENLSVTLANIKRVGKHVYVYGDDIIVPAKCAAIVATCLERYYLKVNVTKSFWTGRFRESCGMDAYDGADVTPVYIRSMQPCNKHDSHSLLSWVATSNLLYKWGYWKTAAHLMSRCESILGPLPVVGSKCGGLGKVSYQPAVSIGRWGRRYQRPEVLTWVVRPIRKSDVLYGDPALTKCLLKLVLSNLGRDKNKEYLKDNVERAITCAAITPDRRHLFRTARPGAVALKRQWIPPY